MEAKIKKYGYKALDYITPVDDAQYAKRSIGQIHEVRVLRNGDLVYFVFWLRAPGTILPYKAKEIRPFFLQQEELVRIEVPKGTIYIVEGYLPVHGKQFVVSRIKVSQKPGMDDVYYVVDENEKISRHPLAYRLEA